MRILLIEDDPMIAESLSLALRQGGYSVDWAPNATMGYEGLANKDYKLLILDLGLPDASGLDILKKLRNEKDALPVFIITARDMLKDIVTSLDCGADDYLIKPFALEELEARIRVLLRRSAGRATTVITYGNITLEPATHGLTIDAKPIVLSGREFSILYVLMENPGSVISRQQLEEKIYGWNEEVGSNTIEYHISQLRKKIGREVIHNIRGVGYTVRKKG